ncbi:MAG: restriction endonuclease subunit S [Candidatus Sulfotelmatobacter sp.]
MDRNVLPKNWRLIPLEEVGDFINGYAFKPSDWGQEGLPIIRIQNLNDATKPYNYFAGQLDNRFRVRSGDILISWSASLGVFRWRNGDAWLNQHIFKVVPTSKLDLDVDYFHWAVTREIEVIAALAHGSTMQHVTRKFFLQSQIPLPPLEEQRAIGRVMRSLETTQAAVERKLNLENERRLVLRNNVFSHGTRGEPLKASAMGDIPQNWQIVELGDLITSGPQNGIYKPFAAYGEGTQIVRIDNFENDGRF